MANKFRLVPMTTAEGSEEGSAVQRRALPDDIPDFWAVQEKEGSRWYTVDTFDEELDAEEFLQQLIDGSTEDE